MNIYISAVAIIISLGAIWNVIRTRRYLREAANIRDKA